MHLYFIFLLANFIPSGSLLVQTVDEYLVSSLWTLNRYQLSIGLSHWNVRVEFSHFSICISSILLLLLSLIIDIFNPLTVDSSILLLDVCNRFQLLLLYFLDFRLLVNDLLPLHKLFMDFLVRRNRTSVPRVGFDIFNRQTVDWIILEHVSD